MRLFATIFVAAVSMVHLASASRINFVQHVSGMGKEEAPSKGKGKGKKGAQVEKGKGEGNGKGSKSHYDDRGSDAPSKGKGKGKKGAQAGKGKGEGNGKSSSRDHYDDRGSADWGYAPPEGDFPPLTMGESKKKDAAVLPLPSSEEAAEAAEEKDAAVLPLPSAEEAAEEQDAAVLPLPSAEQAAEEKDAADAAVLSLPAAEEAAEEKDAAQQGKSKETDAAVLPLPSAEVFRVTGGNTNHYTTAHKKDVTADHALTAEAVQARIASLPLWTLNEKGWLCRTFIAKDFAAAMAFINAVGEICEREQHHPNLHITDYRTVTMELYTHKIPGITENDFVLAHLLNAVPATYSPKWLKEHPEAVAVSEDQSAAPVS